MNEQQQQQQQHPLTVPAVRLSAAQMDVMLLPALYAARRSMDACVARRREAVLLDVVVIDWIDEEL